MPKKAVEAKFRHYKPCRAIAQTFRKCPVERMLKAENLRQDSSKIVCKSMPRSFRHRRLSRKFRSAFALALRQGHFPSHSLKRGEEKVSRGNDRRHRKPRLSTETTPPLDLNRAATASAVSKNEAVKAPAALTGKGFCKPYL